MNEYAQVFATLAGAWDVDLIEVVIVFVVLVRIVGWLRGFAYQVGRSFKDA